MGGYERALLWKDELIWAVVSKRSRLVHHQATTRLPSKHRSSRADVPFQRPVPDSLLPAAVTAFAVAPRFLLRLQAIAGPCGTR